MTDDQFYALVSQFGDPLASYISRDMSTSTSKGYGFVQFATEAEAEAAIAGLDGREIDDRILRARKANAAVPYTSSDLIRLRT